MQDSSHGSRFSEEKSLIHCREIIPEKSLLSFEWKHRDSMLEIDHGYTPFMVAIFQRKIASIISCKNNIASSSYYGALAAKGHASNTPLLVAVRCCPEAVELILRMFVSLSAFER